MIAQGLGSAWLPSLPPASSDLPSLKGFQPFPASYRKQMTIKILPNEIRKLVAWK